MAEGGPLLARLFRPCLLISLGYGLGLLSHVPLRGGCPFLAVLERPEVTADSETPRPSSARQPSAAPAASSGEEPASTGQGIAPAQPFGSRGSGDRGDGSAPRVRPLGPAAGADEPRARAQPAAKATSTTVKRKEQKKKPSAKLKTLVVNGTDTRIPKIIHQTWKSKDLTGHKLAWSRSWRSCLPDWEYRLWDDDENRALVAEHFPDLLRAYDSYPHPVNRADAARLVYLAVFGGVYADVDVECVFDPGNLFAQLGGAAILTTESKTRYLSNAFFVADADRGRAYFRRLVGQLQPSSSKAEMAILGVTGPAFFTKETEAYTGVGKEAWVTDKEHIRHLPLPGGAAGHITVVHDRFFLAVDTKDGGKIKLCADTSAIGCRKWLQSQGSVLVHHWTHTWLKKKGLFGDEP